MCHDQKFWFGAPLEYQASMLPPAHSPSVVASCRAAGWRRPGCDSITASRSGRQVGSLTELRKWSCGAARALVAFDRRS